LPLLVVGQNNFHGLGQVVNNCIWFDLSMIFIRSSKLASTDKHSSESCILSPFHIPHNVIPNHYSLGRKRINEDKEEYIESVNKNTSSGDTPTDFKAP
jgi:hypothetical protein